MTEARPNALQKLIAEYKAGNDDISYARLARNAGERDDGTAWINRSQIQKFATRRLKRPPRDEAVTGLARALETTESVVKAAVGESLEYRDPLPGEVRGHSYAHALAVRIDKVDDAVARGKLLWALEQMVSAVEGRSAPERAAARPAGKSAVVIYDAIEAWTDEQRREAARILRERWGDGVSNGAGPHDG